MKILIIDDEEKIRKLIEYNLSLDGHEVITAKDGMAGLTAAKENMPELILLDVMMPGIDGFQTCRKLKDDMKTKNIPVIMITAKNRVIDVETAFKVGAESYITKPFDPFRLNDTIKKKLKKSKQKKKQEKTISDKLLSKLYRIIR